MRLLISAGEASGEMYGAQLMDALRRHDPGLEFMGVGGERMRAAGCRTVVDARDIAVVGLGEVVSHLPRIWREFRRLIRHIDQQRPDAAVVIDFPDWNLRLARELRRRDIPVVYYVSPQLWAWRPGRIQSVRRYIRKMLVIFPFEEQWYGRRGVDAEFVGHPLADVCPPTERREGFARQHRLDPAKTWIALLPGSRRKEFALNIPEVLDAGRLLASTPDRQPRYEFILPVASTLDASWVKGQLIRYTQQAALPVTVTGDARASLAHARAAVVASGTATVEAAVAGTPFVMVYRVSRLTWLLGRRLVKVPHFAMVNLIAGREIVPELVQSNFTAENVVTKLRTIIPEGPARTQMLAGLADVRQKLRAGSNRPAAERAAYAILAAVRP